MPEIGETLREARMRRRIDMTEVEAATKIRAKYLRALESEEWDLLPGPTFVKTFLRTYAEYLGLDPRLLVEEYRQRFERPASQDLTPFQAGRGGQRMRRRSRGLLGPGVAILLGIAGLLGALYLLGTWGQDDDPGTTPTQAGRETPAPDVTEEETPEPEPERERRRPTRVELRIIPTGDVYVCLQDVRGRVVIDKQTLQEGQGTRTFRGRRFRVTFGTADARMRVDGRTYRVAVSPEPVGYDLRPGRRPRRLPPGELPTCL